MNAAADAAAAADAVAGVPGGRLTDDVELPQCMEHDKRQLLRHSVKISRAKQCHAGLVQNLNYIWASQAGHGAIFRKAIYLAQQQKFCQYHLTG